MTSEVLVLNKRAVIIAADSAITSSGGGHPRYSKSATKIFDLSINGSVGGGRFHVYMPQVVEDRGEDYEIARFREMIREN